MAMAGAATCYLPVSTGSPFQGRTRGIYSLPRDKLKLTGSHNRQLKCVMSLTFHPLPRPEGYVRGFWSMRRNRGVRGSASDSKARTDFVLEGEDDSDIPPPPPPTQGRFEIVLDNDMIARLDLTPAHDVLQKFVGLDSLGNEVAFPGGGLIIDANSDGSSLHLKDLFDRTVGFTLKYERADPVDPRELSELSDVRLWFVRLDAAYPWLPAVLDWRGGELARYSAMLIPHQMSKRLGVVFNPEALELWSMKKFFTVYEWLRSKEFTRPDAKVKEMMTLLGFKISDVAYQIMENDPMP